MDKPGTILLRPADVATSDRSAAADRIDLTVVPVEHGLCRYRPVVGGKNCPFNKNCTNGLNGPCEHFVLTGADSPTGNANATPHTTSPKAPRTTKHETTSLVNGIPGSRCLRHSAKLSTNSGCSRKPRSSICEARCGTTSTHFLNRIGCDGTGFNK
jgi:hypothetical protein